MDEFLDEKALAKRWPIKRRTLQRWRLEGKGPPYVKLGSRVAYPLRGIEEWERTHYFRPG